MISTLAIVSNVHAKDRKKVSEKTKNEIISVLKANEVLHMSFFKYDAKRVEKNANKLNQEISKISDEGIKKLLKFAKSKTNELKASQSQDDNNQNYHIISMALIYLINTYDLGSEYNAYSCPMVKKKWVQNSKKISKVHNPYSAMMPHCGSQDTKF